MQACGFCCCCWAYIKIVSYVLLLWLLSVVTSSHDTSDGLVCDLRTGTKGHALHYGASEATKHASTGLSWWWCWSAVGRLAAAGWWSWWWWTASSSSSSSSWHLLNNYRMAAKEAISSWIIFNFLERLRVSIPLGQLILLSMQPNFFIKSEFTQPSVCYTVDYLSSLMRVRQEHSLLGQKYQLL